MPSSASAFDDLIEGLDLGLGIVTRVWVYPAKDWVTSVFATDIDHNGLPEIIACSRDGRVHVLSQTGELLWKRAVGAKVWIGNGIATGKPAGELESSERIIVGTRDGKVFVLNRFGQTMTKDGQLLPSDAEGNPLDPEQEKQAYWYNTGYPIREISVNQKRPGEILIGSQDRCAYGVNYETGQPLWHFQTNGWVRTICSADVNGDGQDEVLVGSVDRHLYLLDQQGNELARHQIQHPVQTIAATDVDSDGQVEILIATEGKDLVALNFVIGSSSITGCFEEKWRRFFGNRLLSLCVVDIDGDGMQEIIVGSEDKHIYFLDDRGNTLWRHNHRCSVFSLYQCDIDNNGRPELLVGSSNNRISALRIRLRKGIDKRIRRAYERLEEPDPAEMAGLSVEQRALLQDVLERDTGSLPALEQAQEQPDIKVSFMTVEQAREQLTTKAYKEALLTLCRLEQQKVERLWQKDIPYTRTVRLRHIMGEQVQEIVVGTSTGDIHNFSAEGKLLWSRQFQDHIMDIQTGFVDHRQKEEIIICTSDRHQIYIVDGPQQKNTRNLSIDETWMSSVCVLAPNLQGESEILISTEDKKLYIYRGDSQNPVGIISTQEGVRLARANIRYEEHGLQIVAASLSNCVYAYTRRGEALWRYETKDRIQAVCIKDINQDGKAEVLIGSEDRNIHVIDTNGNLLWRFYLSHRVLAVDATESDGTIFVGCADGNLYVFNKEGDLLWTYQAKDRIHALRVADIDNDGKLEIVLGTEDQLDVLRMLNQQDIDALMEQCWQVLCRRQHPEQAIADLLASNDPFLQIFALRHLDGREHSVLRDFDRLEHLARAGVGEVRRALVQAAMRAYSSNPSRARALLFQLSTDPEQTIRRALIEHIPMLIDQDWELCFHYLERAIYDPDRFLRRLAVRKLYELIDNPGEKLLETHQKIFNFLLIAMQNKESEWIRQEATRSMAHLLNQHYSKLIVSFHLFIVKHIPRKLWEQFANGITNPYVKDYLKSIIQLVFDLDEENASERISQVVKAVQATEQFDFGPDMQRIYEEILYLFTIQTVAGIANYRCKLNSDQFSANNQFARILLGVFNKFSIISRPLKMYLGREGIQDRQASLLEALASIEYMHKFVDQQYTHRIMDEPITDLPDHRAFLLLLEKWRKMVQERLDELRGKAELKAELQANDARYDNRVGIWLNVKNTGRGVATAIKVTLHQETHYEHFRVVGTNCLEFDALLPQEETSAEFIIEPHCTEIPLKFDIAYDDVDSTPMLESHEDSLKLRETYQEFRYIPNSYSTGTPTPDRKMFYGREKDMAYLKDNLTRRARTVIVLYGQRRSGKTTILLQLANSTILEQHIPVLIDMQRISYLISIDTLLHRVASFIAQAMRKRNISIGEQPELESYRGQPTHTFDLFLDQVEELLGERKLILLIDEFEVLEDQIKQRKLQPEIFDYLRDIIQHRQHINFLFSGTHKITEYTRSYRSIFFNIALHRKLSRLTPEGAEALIQKPVEGYLEYEPLTIKKIHQLTADQPYLIHLMCRAIVDYCNERGKTFVTINDVNVVLREVMQTGQFHFEWLWNKISRKEQLALAALAEAGKEEGRWLSFTEIEEIYSHYNIPYKREFLLDSLKALTEEDFIESKSGSGKKMLLDSNKYRIPVGLTRSWLLEEHPMVLVCKEISNEAEW